MSYHFKENETIYWPGSRPFELNIDFRGETERGNYYETNSFCAAEHGGTHMDAPSHFVRGKPRVHDVPLDALIGPAVKIDIKSKADEDSLAEMEVADLEDWEEANGRIPDDVIVMVYSGRGSQWLNRTAYLGSETNNASLLHFPGIHPDAARWLVNNRKIKCVGIDTPSPDHGQSQTLASHLTFFNNNIPVLENVANLDKLPSKGATVFAIPMKIHEGSGAPTRIFATGWNPDLNDPCRVVGGACHPTFGISLLLSIVANIFIKLVF
ncbi:kynurenine formamidase-like [Ptychodera flava]|uniref:kynurenine formamidase-like n=1 Tax=Ptychodera flava TaxID=63121 RepID=UPI003969D2BB